MMTQTTRRQLLLSAAGIAATSRPIFCQNAAANPNAASALRGATTLLEFEPMARARLSNMAYEYIAGGAGSEVTLRRTGRHGSHSAPLSCNG